MKPSVPELKFKIASPCHARWEDMTGDERSRLCGQCEKRVYNFSKMGAEEITRLLDQTDGQVCARFYQRRDGTVMLENCPVGVERFFRKVKMAVCSFIAFLVVSLGALVVSARPSREVTYSRANALLDEAVATVKGWFGIQPPMIMGEICVPTPNQTSPTQTGTNSEN